MDAVNRQVRLAARPVGLPKPTDWDHTEEPVAEPADGEVLVKVKYLSLDPAMRGWMNEGRSYIPPVGIGEVMRAGGCGEVIASEHPGFEPGDHVTGITGIQEHAVLAGDGLIKVDPGLAPLPVYLGHARHAGHDRVLRAAGHRQAQGGRHGRRLGRGGRRRQRRRPDREDQGLPRASASPVARRSAATSWTNWDSTRPSTTSPRTSCGPCASTAPTASTCTSTTSAARSWTPRSPASPAHARVVICGAISQYNATERHAGTVQLHVAAGQPGQR